MDQSADTPDLQLNDTQAKRKRTSFVGKEKFIRDALLIGLATKCKKARIKNEGRLPHGFVSSIVQGCQKYCPSFQINQSTIKNAIEKKTKQEENDSSAMTSNISPLVDKSAAEVLVAMKKSITPVVEHSTTQAARAKKLKKVGPSIEIAIKSGSRNTAVVDPSPVPPSRLS